MNKDIEQTIFALERPNQKLLFLYFVRSLAALIMFPIVFAPLVCKYLSLQYHFDKEGIGASWGIFFKKQVFLTYARIQDIHVSRGLVERWLNLGTVEIQTASGSASAELSVVGLEEYDLIRDFLYSKMRGVRGESEEPFTTSNEPSETLQILYEMRDEIRAIRQSVEQGSDDHV